MPKPTYRFEVDWDHDKLYAHANRDITSYVLATGSWAWSSGRSGNSALTSKSKAGKLTLPLNNTTGIFSSFKTSGALFGKLLPGRRCRVSMAGRAAQFTAADSESLSIADNAAMSTGDIDFSWAGWVYLDDKSADRQIAGKWDTASNNREWNVGYDNTGDRFRFIVSPDGTSTNTSVDADNLGSPSTGRWYFIVVWHDATANTINIQVDNGTVDSVAHTTGLSDQGGAFELGARNGGAADFFDGRMVAGAFWKKVLTAAERTWLYHEGNGRIYGDIGRTGDGSALKTSLQSWHELDEASGTRVDAHGSNDLTDNNTVTDAEGITNNLVWSGRLDSIVPNSTIGSLAEATLTALGNLAVIAAGKPRSTRRTSILTSDAIDVILDDIGWPASSTGARDINAGQTTMDPWYYSSARNTHAMKEASKIEDTEFGLFRESERDDVVFEDRHYRLSGARLTSQKTYADDGSANAITYQKIPQRDPVGDVYNRVTTRVPSQSLAALAVLWTLGATGANSPLIGPGETQRFVAEYPTPDAVTQDIGAVWTTLVENTDYEANSASDGSGTDLSGSLTITLTKALDVMVISILNGHATLSAYITLLQARGQAVQDGDLQVIEDFDQSSIDDFGDREYPLRAEFIPSMQEAVDYVRYVLALNKDIAPKMNVSFLASKDFAHTKEAAIRRLSDKLTIISDAATELGLASEEVFVEKIDHMVVGGGAEHWVTLTLSSATKVAKVIVLDTGPGLGTGILGY